MDRYTLMASKLTQLQEGKVLGFKDEVWYRGEIYTIIDIVSSYPISLYTIKNGNYNEMPVVPPKELIYRPSLEDLIGMLEEHRKSKGQCDCTVCVNCAFDRFLNAQLDADCEGKILSFKEYWLKLVAYERWGVSWNEKKETWE